MIWLATVWRWFLSTAIGRWIVGVGAVLLGILALAYTAFLKGKHAQAGKDQAKDAEASQRAAQEAIAAKQRSDDAVRATNDEVSKMPDDGTQKVGDADPGSAADWLRQNADRDQAGP